MQAQFISIQEAAKCTGLSEHTLRYYEKLGIMEIERDSVGYRRFTEHDIAWIGFIQRLKITGMPLKDIQRLIALRKVGKDTLPQRRQIIIEHKTRVESKIQTLKQELRKIDEKIEYYNDLLK